LHPDVQVLDRRVTDGVIRRMIDKWLKAGILEDGLLRHATEGSPQGGVIKQFQRSLGLQARIFYSSRQK
jgi:hypothetical protein